MDSTDNVIFFWWPRLGIIQKKSWLLNSHMAYAWCVKFVKVPQWGIPLFDQSVTQDLSMITRSFWMNLISMICTLLVFYSIWNQFWQYSLRNVYHLWQPDEVHQLFLGLVKDWLHYLFKYLKLEMSRVDLTKGSHRYHGIRASSASVNYKIKWRAAPGREERSGAWSEHWYWTVLRFFTAPRMAGELQQKQSLRKW